MSPAQVQRSWRSFALPCFLLSTNSIAYLCKYIKAKGTKICTNIYVQICIMRIYMLSTVLCYTSFKYLTGEKEVVTMSPASKAQQRAVNKYMKKNPVCLDDFEILVMRLKSRLGKGFYMRNLISPKETGVRRTYEQHRY